MPGDRVRTIATGRDGPISALAWRPDGQAIASADAQDNAVNIWTPQSGAPVGPALTGPTGLIRVLTFSQDGSRIAAGCFDKSVWVWDTTQSPSRRQRLDGSAGVVSIVGFSADGRRLMAVSPLKIESGDTSSLKHETNIFESDQVIAASSVRVWNTDTGGLAGKPLAGERRLVAEPVRPGADFPIIAAAISPDGQRILVSTEQGLALRDVASGQAVGKPWRDVNETSAATAVAFSSDGRYAVSAGPQTANLHLWEASSGRPLGEPLQGHSAGVITVAFAARDRIIISRGVDGWMAWPGPSQWRDELCGKLTANMTTSEWNDWVSPSIAYQEACHF